MSTSQRARSGVPLDHRSILATLPGVPAWGAVAIAAGITFLGFLIDAARGTELTTAFAFLYVIGCIAAVLLVRYRGLFTAMVQAPLILFVAVPLSYQYLTENAGTGLKDIILNVAIPLVNRFPLMLLGTALAVGLGALRIFLKRQSTHAPATRRTPKPRAERAKRTGTDRSGAERPSTDRSGADWSSTDRPGIDRSTRAGRRQGAEEATRSRRTHGVAGRNDVSASEVTDVVQDPYSGRRRAGVDSRSADPRETPRRTSPRRAAPRPSRSESRYSSERPYGQESRSSDSRSSDSRNPEPRTSDPRTSDPRTSDPRNQETRAQESRDSEPRRHRGSPVQPPREVADPYTSGARPIVPPRSGDIPPHPVPRVRYRDRLPD